MEVWQPEQRSLRELLLVLGEAANPNSREQGLINQRLLSFNEVPEYNNYLAYILTQLTQCDINIRRIAGLQLKNNIKNSFNNIQLAVLDYVKQCCVNIIESPQLDIATTVSSVVAAIVRRGQVHNWLQVIVLLIQKLDDPRPDVMKMALDTLAMICEDAAPELDQEMHGIRPLQFLIPKLLHFYNHPDPQMRVQAINATSQFVLLKPASFVHQLDFILNALYTRASIDDNPRVRQELGRILTVILEAFPEHLQPYLYPTIEYMLNATRDTDHEILLGACDFWVQYAHSDYYRQELITYLPQLVKYLLKLMVYSDSDLLDLEDGSTGTSNGDGSGNFDNQENMEDQSIRPRFYRPKNALEPTDRDELSDLEEDSSSDDDDDSDQEEISSDSDDESGPSNNSKQKTILADDDNEQEDEDDDDDLEEDDFFSEDSLRKCSAAALDALSVSFGDDIAHIILNRLFEHTLYDEDWLVRESGILALGAAAEGCIQVISNHMYRVVPFLLKSMQDPQPLVRSISCWAVSRFSNWLADEYDANEEGRKQFFEPVLFGILNCLLDSNRRVQEAACTAFIMMGESAGSRLKPYIGPILQRTHLAAGLYRRKNRLFLYDALGTLADAVGAELNHEEFIALLMPPLISKWNELSDDNTDLFPLLECLSNITAALGPGFEQYVEPVLSRCVKLISSTLHEQKMADQCDTVAPPNVEFMIAALDLLSGIVQGLGPAIEPLIAQTNPPLLALLKECIHDPVSEVLQSTFALIGDIAIASFGSLLPFLHDILRELIVVLKNKDYMMSVSVYNNALWAMGEIVMRCGDGVTHYVPELLDLFSYFLTHPQAPASIHENAMIALGRLGLACPMTVAPKLKGFVKPWLEKSLSVREGSEKDSAFRGLCVVIKHNAQDAQEELYLLLVSMSTIRTPSNALLAELKQVVNLYRTITPDYQWRFINSKLDPDAQRYIVNILSHSDA